MSVSGNGSPGLAAAESASAGAESPARTVSVLVVDDDRDYGVLVRRAVRGQDPPFEVTHVTDGLACMEALARREYSVVLLDYRLPRQNGLEVLARIRAISTPPPVVIVTGQGDERVAVQAMKAGAIDYVVKNSGYFATLPTVLTKVLKQHELALDNTRLYAESQSQQRLLAQVLDATSDGIVMVDREGRVACANRRAGDLLNFDPSRAVGVALVDLLSAEDAAAAFLGLLQRPEHAGEGELVVARRILHWVGQPTVDARGTALGFTVTLQDVTREREIGRMKSDFVSFAAHQLRTPLSGIRWMLELAMKEPALTAAPASYIGDAAESAHRLIGLVNDLLNVARLESGALRLTPEVTRLEELTREVLRDLAAPIAERRHRVTVDEGEAIPSVRIDRAVFHEALANLVSNAVKYTPPDGEIAIRLFREGATVIWEIRDSGIGIPRDAHARLFEKFFRADNAAKIETEGTGLGLYLVRLSVTTFGGQVSCASQEGQGTTFTVRLPAVS